MKLSFYLIIVTSFLFRNSFAAQTWPSPIIDEMEDLMYVLSGYRSRGFATGVSPCNKSPPGTSGRTASAEWIRTAFHDAASGNVNDAPQVNGMDGSIMFETGFAENIGPAFASTVQAMAAFYNSRASLADLLALALGTATRSCGGPIVPLRVGRKDSTIAGPSGFVPVPQSAVSIFVNQFARLGFSAAEMIAIVACGHTVGGVHSNNFPTIVAPASDGSDVYTFVDSTSATFDNTLVTEYLSNTSTDPMGRGRCTTRKVCADAVVFGQDKNVTMKKLADATYFASTCANVFQRMVEVVPTTTTLSANNIVPYEVKPNLQLTLLDGGSKLNFAGEIRVRTTVRSQSQIASVQINYLDRSGGNTCGSCVIMTSAVGNANGFDESFSYYSFSSTIDAVSSISSFTVQVNLASGSSQIYDNNGGGFPVQDSIMLQMPQSCLVNNNLNVVAAVRNTLSSANLAITLQQARDGVPIPSLITQTQAMTKGAIIGPYTLFSTSYTLPSNQSMTTRFDVIAGNNIASDSFKLSGNLGSNCAVLNGASTTSSSTTSISSTASSTNTQQTTMQTVTVSNSTATGSSSMTNSNSGTSTTTIVTTVSTGNTISTSTVVVDSKTTTSLTTSSVGNSSPSGSSATSSTSSTLSSSSSSSSMMVSSSTSTSTSTSTSPFPSTTTTTTSSSSSSPTPGWTRLGCYTDTVSSRTLPNALAIPGGSSNMTITNCLSAARTSSYKYAGIEYAQECWASNTIANGGMLASDGEVGCNMACSGNTTQNCGGGNRLNLWVWNSGGGVSSSTSGVSTATTPATSISQSPTPTPTPSQTPPTLSNWSYLGCYIDSTSRRTLLNLLALPGGVSNTSNALCQSTAQARGYAYAGTEYSGECWADNTLSSTGVAAADAGTCNMLCNGGSGGEICGGPDRLTLFGFGGVGSGSAGGASSSSASSSLTSTTSTSTSTSTSSTSTSTPAPPPTAPNWTYLGCHTDTVNPRVLPNSLPTLGGPSNMTNYNCQIAASLAGFTYAGTEYSGECWAGGVVGSGGGLASDGEKGCSMVCNGAGGEICGGPARLSLWGFKSGNGTGMG